MPAEMVTLGLAQTSASARFRQIGAPRLVNCVPEIATGTTQRTQQMPLGPRPGLARWATLEGGPIRGGVSIDRVSSIVVAGSNIYRLGPGGAGPIIGRLPGSGRVHFAVNRRSLKQVAAVTNGQLFVIEGGLVEEVKVPTPGTGFISPIDASFLNGYVLMATRSGRLHWLGIDDMRSVSPLNFVTAEGSPDGLVRCVVRKFEAWLFGESTIEVWTTTGDLNAPLARLPGGFLETGLLAPDSLVKIGDTLVWVDDDYTVQASGEGYSSSAISPPWLARMIEDLDDPAGLRAWTYTLAGHDVYVLSSPDWTLTFDFHSKVWLHVETEGMNRWRGDVGFSFAGLELVGDLELPHVYRVDEKHYRDDDRPIVMRMRLPTVSAEPRPIVFFSVIPSVSGRAVDGEENPVVRLRWSDDGGERWSGWREKRLPAAGAPPRKLSFNQLGQSSPEGRVLEFSMDAGPGRAFVNVMANVAQALHA